MRQAVDTGIGFGVSSGVITTMGLMVGLYAGTRSTLAVAGGIVTIAIADALSDALGIHIAEESRGARTVEVWLATTSTFFAKFIIALTFLLPVLFLELGTAVTVSVVWGFAVIAGLSYRTARLQGSPPWKVIAEHLVIAVAVVALTHWVGIWVARTFVQ